MGMFNEVFKTCPHCLTGKGYAQIKPQIVMGFGEFDLDHPETLSELSTNELRELLVRVREDGGLRFECPQCNHVFRYGGVQQNNERRRLLAALTGGNHDDVE